MAKAEANILVLKSDESRWSFSHSSRYEHPACGSKIVLHAAIGDWKRSRLSVARPQQ